MQRITKERADQMSIAVVRYKRLHGRWPASMLELTEPDPRGRCLVGAPDTLDAWGRPFELVPGENGFPAVVSFGANGISDGHDLALGANMDVSSHRPLPAD